MTWNTFHTRGEILQLVVDTADIRRDGLLPMELPGVSTTFRDELDLIAALWLKWNARLSGNIERALTAQPLDLERAVAAAWTRTSQQMPGLRLILDHHLEWPTDPQMATALNRAVEKERIRLAAAAGLANDESPAAARAGRQVELRARAALADEAAAELLAPATTDMVAAPSVDESSPSLVARIKAVLAA